MEKIKLTFLGTSAAIPTASRNHPSILLSYKKENILIDCGEGTQRQLKKAKVSPNKISHLLITHWHGDHTLGILGLLQTQAMSGSNKALYVYGPKGTKSSFALLDRFMSPYKKLSNSKINITEGSSTIYESPEIKLEASAMKHGIPSNAYSFTIKPRYKLLKSKLKALKLPHSPILKKLQQGKTVSHKGKRISPKQVASLIPQKKVTFIMDTLPNPNTLKIAKNSDLLITECTYSSKDKELATDHKHLTSKDAATIAKKAKVKSLVLTHISERYNKSRSTILKEAKSIFPKTKLVDDLDVIEI